jgi:2-polyprenyl-3-methyl-5-hydroxy-6-metoxy-1,4-benzoquinol methylase
MDIGTLSSRLRRADDGIWHATDAQAISYPSEGNDNCFAVERDSWWFNHRNDCILAAVETFPPPSHGSIFDVGGGNGFVSQGLARAGFNTVLVEPGEAGARNAKARGVENVICATTETAGLEPGSLPAVGLFDVIEHIKDDIGFLKHIHMLLKDDGLLYATVPSYQMLWSGEDVRAGHFRRYSREQICRTLSQSGFDVLFSSYFFRPLPIPIFLLRALPHMIGISRNLSSDQAATKDHASPGKLFSWALERALRRETGNLRRKKPMRFGASCLLVARPRLSENRMS